MAPRVMTIQVGHSTVKLMADDKVSALIEAGPYEPETIEAWAEACADGRAQTAIDVGAYSGIFSIGASLLGNYSIAIEAKSELAERVRMNVHYNKVPVTVIEAAASNYDGDGTLHTNGSVYSFASSLKYDPVKQAHNRTRPVKVVKLDSLPYKGKVGAIKIDVEGHEYEVLEGAVNTINRDRPVLLIETLDDENRKRRAISVLPSYYYCAGFLDGRNLYMVPA